jgi:hypothetical protein
MGPTTLPRDRFDYAAAISESWKNQMLLNLVKARYSDAPVFLDIASAINSYSIETDVSVAAGFQTPLATIANSLGLGAGGRRICMRRKRINLSHVFAGQRVGIKEVDEGIWIVSFMQYDLGHVDLEQKTLQPLDNPLGTRLSPMS